ncbi:MAG: 6-carboxytetrahydropterin synthase [Prolixibacteraceae bacterium]|nr:6-carboxytetrahydropterin synthase [Prolixibacteraceae bacterium]
MAKIRITKQFDFETAHALTGYDGLCSNIHGHSYKLDVTVIGEVLQKLGHPKNGMVMDLCDLKEIVNTHVVSKLDHSFMISKTLPPDLLDGLRKNSKRLLEVDFQPTSENIALYIAGILKQILPATVSLFSIRLAETSRSYVEWFASDN